MRGCQRLIGIVALMTANLVGILPAGTAHAQTGGNVTRALTGGTASADVRYRFAFISRDNGLKDAKASTVRTRLGYRTEDLSGFSAFVQFSDTRVIGVGDYNSTTNGQVGYAVEPDPKLTQISQAYLDFAPTPVTRLRVGRQRIIFDNARFVGNVGWRQNLQTFDSISFTDALLSNVNLTYAYLYNVSTVTGAQQGVSSHLVNVSLRKGAVKLVGYAYLLSFDRAPLNSSKTVGLRLTGSRAFANLKGRGLYTLEYAKQTPYDNGDSHIDGDYYMGELGASFADKTLKVSYEVLGADHYAGFQTPLATKHGFNGWADQFLTTPKDGLADWYVTAAIHPPGFTFMTVYHRFTAQRGGAHYGDELDLMLSKRLGKHYTLLTEYARYRADRFSVDTDKFWVQGSLVF